MEEFKIFDSSTILGAGVEYKVIESVTLDADFTYFDRLFRRDNFNSGDVVLRNTIGQLPSYGLLDVGATYRFNLFDNIMVARGNVFNLLDNEYLNQSDAFGVLNGNGRTWNISLQVLF